MVMAGTAFCHMHRHDKFLVPAQVAVKASLDALGPL